QRINPNVYRLRMDDRYPGLPIFNFEHLKPYREGDSSHRWNKKKRKREYLIRWKGYGPHYDTWQVEYDLRSAPDTLAEYKREKGL
ncbi:uncharacterized protein SCHCODRAFT_02479113, partial [Schizophyllum commune H4-8]|uniref:uncharacterized protein n=1 Tax=Schizophyllum commune (strain H4-8 / FGSC 9210) TaxID=578458 RepID=UPI00215EE987